MARGPPGKNLRRSLRPHDGGSREGRLVGSSGSASRRRGRTRPGDRRRHRQQSALLREVRHGAGHRRTRGADGTPPRAQAAGLPDSNAGGPRPGRGSAARDPGGGGRGMCCGCCGALVGRSAHDQCLWPDRGDGVRDHERSALRRGHPADWAADLEHACLCVGRWLGACSCWGMRGALHCGCGAGAGLSGACGADRGAVRGRPVRTCGQPDVPHRGSGALALGRGAGVPGACGRAGEDARLPHRAWRDRGGAGAARERCAGGGDCARGGRRRPAAGWLCGGGPRSGC